jgi:hypothetical protein
VGHQISPCVAWLADFSRENPVSLQQRRIVKASSKSPSIHIRTLGSTDFSAVKAFPAYHVRTMRESKTMKKTDPKRNFFQTAVYNFFALYLGVTPPAPGKEGFYATLLIVSILILMAMGFLIVRLLLTRILG